MSNKPAERFRVTEIAKCICNARRFLVDDLVESDTIRAHVGNLNPHDMAHQAVRKHLQREQESWKAKEKTK